ncbi:MAG: efflux RND transporter permease subunit [Endomicrobium sp.]|jgi:HAE1 family hydrophobic/amphiphilic exporter-1|nr:efflux RND transporter permease subunit [Endomicrobium sp.]
MNIAKFTIKRPTFIVALLIIMLLLGVTSFTKLNVRMFPDVDFPYVLIFTVYRGAGVSEVEQLITKPMEDTISGVSGLKHINSISEDGISILLNEFELSKNPDVATQEIRDKIHQIKPNLPRDIDEPVIIKADINSMPIISLSLKSKNMTVNELYDFADNIVSKDLTKISGVSRINIVGGTKKEIHVNVDKEKLRQHEFTLMSMASKIKMGSLNIPAGTINQNHQEINFKTIGEFKSIKAIEDVVLNFFGNDKPITVGNLANVTNGFESESSKARFDTKENGKIIYEQSLLLQIYKQAKCNDVIISDTIKKNIEQLNKKYKKINGKPHLTIIFDAANRIRANINDVKSTILEGIILSILIVYLFLGNWKSTFITALAIPNSLIGSFILIYIFGFSLNVLSLMALSLSIGLLIDDAIVVRENIFRHYESGSNPMKAAIDGTNEVTLAVIATTSTVIAVFLPIAFLGGIAGRFFREFALTVIFAVIISIIDALTIAPLLSTYIISDNKEKENIKSKHQKLVFGVLKFFTIDLVNKIFEFVKHLYIKIISFIIKKKFLNFKFHLFGKRCFTISWKIITLFITLFVFFETITLASKYIKISFMPYIESDEFNINIRAKPGTSLCKMDEYTKEIEQLIMNDKNIDFVSSVVGSNNLLINLSNESNIYVKLIPIKQYHISDIFSKKSKINNLMKRIHTSSEIKDYIRKILNKKYGKELEFSIVRQSLNNNNENEFIMELSGADANILYDFAKHLIQKYKTIIYLVDIQSNYKPGKPEVRIHPDPKKMINFGVDSVTIGNEVKAIINGVKAGKYRENGIEYDILVKFQNDQQNIEKNFSTIYVNNINNKLIKLKDVTTMEHTLCPTSIFKKNRAHFITIEGNISKGGTIGDVQKQALKLFNIEKSNPKYFSKWKNIVCNFSGNIENMHDMFKDIIIAGMFSVILVFMILASLYESVIIPLTIMIALPFAIIGGVISLLISNQSIDIFTLIGMIMLLGIVAKNSILLVDYIQQQMHKGVSIDDAIIQAGSIRLRPILMTSFALIAGMLPTALGLSEAGKFRKGMGIVVIGGVISSTILTLIIVPALFEYMDNLRHFLRRIIGRPKKRIIDLNKDEFKNKIS